MTTAEAPQRRERPGKAAILRAAVEVMGEDGYEGASIRDMATRAGVSVAALYYHFPSKLDLLREFLDEAYDITLARIERRLATAGQDPAERLDVVVGTLIWTNLHDDFAQLASNVALREHTRLKPPERAAIEVKRKALLDLVESVVADLGRSGDPREAARSIITLSSSLVEPYADIGLPLDGVIELYQRYALAIAHV
jgi:AcrR family transcriptional regulator